MLSLLLIGSVSIDRVGVYYTYSSVDITIYFNNLIENPFNDRDYTYISVTTFYYFQSFARIPCILNQLVFRNMHTNEVFQAEYAGTCQSGHAAHSNIIHISMNPRDFLRLVVNKFIDTNSTMPLGLELYTADMLGAPFNFQIEPDDAIECDLRLSLSSYVRISDPDYWINDSILLIHFNTFIDVATVNASKLSLFRNYNRDVNNTVNITNGEILNQSPGLARNVGIKLTSIDIALLESKGICIGGKGSSIRDCYFGGESGFAATYYGQDVFPITYYRVVNIRRAPTSE